MPEGDDREIYLPRLRLTRRERIAISVLAILGCFLLFTLRSYTVVDDSMYPGYKSGSHVLTFNLVAATSLFAHPGQVCIVANRFVPELDGAPTLIKRILAGPGDSVEFRRGGIFVNGGGTGYASSGNSESTLLLSAQQYFVVGDNADYSMDSRNFGPVKGSDLLGIVIFHF